jgi:poly-gamma-glutamate capsule biosynthesis protein CapA/YwtB (metallophosphatase superfamily)
MRYLTRRLFNMASTSASAPLPSAKTYHLNFVGDIMLGRLIDGLIPINVSDEEDASHCRLIREHIPNLQNYNSASPWGDTLPLFHSADLNLINLETAVTTSEDKWPNKVFNYRAHPERVQCLKEARIDYAGLANNHTLDFGVEGLEETIKCVRNAGVAFAGVGLNKVEAIRPAVLRLPRVDQAQDGEGFTIHVYAASDHPSNWKKVPGFHLIEYSAAERKRLRELLTSTEEDGKPALKVFSVHWGPNYAWQPADEIRDLAHFLIDECGVDIIHGHSSHHVQGVEVYEGKLIIYGCGDFVDDYAVNTSFRNDLSAVWRVTVGERRERGVLQVMRLDIFPAKIDKFRTTVLKKDSEEYAWICNKIGQLSRDLGTKIEDEKGDNAQLVVNVS